MSDSWYSASVQPFNASPALAYAEVVGQRLLAAATVTEHGWHWETVSVQARGLAWNQTDSFYAGTTGYLWFLLELYRLTGATRYLEAVEQGLNALLARLDKQPTGNYSLYLGCGGLVALLLRLRMLAGTARYATVAWQLMQEALGGFMTDREVANGLFDGRAGLLVLLLEFLATDHRDAAISAVHEVVGLLLRFMTAGNGGRGGCWPNAGSLDLAAPVGLAFGVAGIANALRLVAEVFPSPALTYLQTLCQDYILLHYDPKTSKWPDLHKSVNNASELDAYLVDYQVGDRYILQPGYEIDLARGTAGILQAMPNLPLHIAVPAWASLSVSSTEALGLFDGLAGLGYAWLLKDPKNALLPAQAQTIATHILSLPQPGCLSMAEGATGIAYFLLQLHAVENGLPHLALPGLGLSTSLSVGLLNTTLSVQQVRTQLIRHAYARTLQFAREVYPELDRHYFEQTIPSTNELRQFGEFVQQQVSVLPVSQQQEQLAEIYELETALMQVRDTQPPALWLYLQEQADYLQTNALFNGSDEWIARQPFIVSDRLTSIPTKWNWSLSYDMFFPQEFSVKQMLGCPAGQYESYIQLRSHLGAQEYSLPLSGIVLKCFSQPTTITDATLNLRHSLQYLDPTIMRMISERVRAVSEEDLLQRLDHLVLYQVMEYLNDGVLQLVVN